MVSPLWLILLAGLNGADAGVTAHNAAQRSAHVVFSEANPAARYFVTRGVGPTVGYFAATTAAEEWTARRFERRGHRKLALALRIVSSAAAVYGITTSVRGGKW